MQLFMYSTAASPECILEAGKVYEVPARIGRVLCNAKIVGNCTLDEKSGKIHVGDGGPCAEQYDPRKHGKRPILRVPARPDPEDRMDISEEEDFEALEEDS